MIKILAIICACISLICEFSSYWKQISKTLKTKQSIQVSSSAYLFKIAKIFFNLINLFIFSNYIGFAMEAAALCICIAALMVVAHFKPSDWKLFDFKIGQ